jgi:hypothetical protein
MSPNDFSNKLPGRLVLFGFASLFVAMALGLTSLALLTRGGGGGTLLSLAKFFGVLWLPFVILGALVRISNRKPAPDASVHEDEGSGTSNREQRDSGT